MKKSLLVLSLLATLALTGCKGGKKSESEDPDKEKAKVVEKAQAACEASMAYEGAITLHSKEIIEGIEERTLTYDPVTHKYAQKTHANGDYKVVVPGENDTVKYYLTNGKTPSLSYYQDASTDFVVSGLMDEYFQEPYTGAIEGLGAIFGNALDESKKDYFVIIAANTMEMFDDMDMVLVENSIASDLKVEEGSAIYSMSFAGASAAGTTYPRMEIDIEYSAKFTDKVSNIKELIKMKMMMAEGMEQTASMSMELDVSYAFDNSFYAEAMQKTEGVNKGEGSDGYVTNQVKLCYKGAEITYARFQPNQSITVATLTTQMNVDTSGRVTLQGFYTDPDYQNEYVETASKIYEQRLYPKFEAKSGYATIYNVVNRVEKYSSAFFGDEGLFEFYKAVVGSVDETYYGFDVIANTSAYNPSVNFYKRDIVASMKLNGEPFADAKISVAQLQSASLHTIETEVYIYTGQEGTKSKPMLLPETCITNDSTTLVMMAALRSYTNEEYYGKFSMSEVQNKGLDLSSAKMMRSNYLLNKTEAVPESATQLAVNTDYKLTFYISGNAVTSIPEGYTGDVVFELEMKNAGAFNYLVIE